MRGELWGMHTLSIIPALISLMIRSRVRESEVWEAAQERMRSTRTSFRDITADAKIVRRSSIWFSS